MLSASRSSYQFEYIRQPKESFVINLDDDSDCDSDTDSDDAASDTSETDTHISSVFSQESSETDSRSDVSSNSTLGTCIPLASVKAPTYLGYLVAAHEACGCQIFGQDQCPPETLIIEHLHSNPPTLSDIETLIPAMNGRYSVTSKLATSIAWYYSQHKISSSELEDILTHVLLEGDERHIIYERIHGKIARFKAQKEDNAIIRKSHVSIRAQQQARRKEKQAERARELHERREQRQLEERLSTYDSYWFTSHENIQIIPGHCSSIAEYFADVCGLAWEDTRVPTEYSNAVYTDKAPKPPANLAHLQEDEPEDTYGCIKYDAQAVKAKACEKTVKSLMEGVTDRLTKQAEETKAIETSQKSVYESRGQETHLPSPALQIDSQTGPSSDYLFSLPPGRPPTARIPILRSNERLIPSMPSLDSDSTPGHSALRPRPEGKAWPVTRRLNGHLFYASPREPVRVKLAPSPVVARVRRRAMDHQHAHRIAVPRILCCAKPTQLVEVELPCSSPMEIPARRRAMDYSHAHRIAVPRIFERSVA